MNQARYNSLFIQICANDYDLDLNTFIFPVNRQINRIKLEVHSKFF